MLCVFVLMHKEGALWVYTSVEICCFVCFTSVKREVTVCLSLWREMVLCEFIRAWREGALCVNTSVERWCFGC